MLHTFVFILQILIALLVVVLMAVQTDKAEQGGVMGIGAAGGRSSSDIDMAVGPERILKPLTKWSIVAFLFVSILNAIQKVTIFHFLGFLIVYVVIMMFGPRLWLAFTGARR